MARDQNSNECSVNEAVWEQKIPVFNRLLSRSQPMEENLITISSVRESFLKLPSDQVATYHPKDLEKIKNDDKFIQRFIDGALFGKSSVTNEDVTDLITVVLRWRQEFGINDFTASDFPTEFIKSGIFKQATLSNGDILICIIGRRYKKVGEWTDRVLIPGILWYYETILFPNLKDGCKLHLLIDLSNCGLDQADTTFIFMIAPILINYYPGIVSKVYFHNVPWIFKPFTSLFLSLIPRKFKDIIFVIDKKSRIDMLRCDNVPDFMDGPLITTGFDMPTGLSDIETVGVKRGFKRANIDKFKRMIQEAQEKCP